MWIPKINRNCQSLTILKFIVGNNKNSEEQLKQHIKEKKGILKII